MAGSFPATELGGQLAPDSQAKLFAPEGADVGIGMPRGIVARVLRQKAAGRYSNRGGEAAPGDPS